MRKKLVAALIQVLVIFFNTSPVLEDAPDGVPTRENTPWYIFFPSLGVCLQAMHPNGQPITGYWDASEAGSHAASLYQQISADPNLLTELRTNPDLAPTVLDGYKMMSRTISVPA